MFGWRLIRKHKHQLELVEAYQKGAKNEIASGLSIERLLRRLIEKGGHFYYEHELGTYEVSVKKVKR